MSTVVEADTSLNLRNRARNEEVAEIVAGCMPRQRPGQIHPATRSFQALRIAVNDELGQLVQALEVAETVLAPGGRLVVVPRDLEFGGRIAVGQS